MINVAQVRAHIEAMQGEVLVVPKLQLIELLAEVELGQAARRALTGVRSLVSISNGITGVAA